ncbi:MAG: SH3 domain-containing protein [Anaerolineae bacterium]|nr:SH3 domain-containing protein [Anaerolineae bacterium]
MMRGFKSPILTIAVLVAVLAAGALPPAYAQEDGACPALVEEALARAGQACSLLGRNEVCYGNNRVSVTDWAQAALAGFAAPGDTADIVQVATLTTAPMSLEENVWGVAVLALQADLPGTAPGQNVTFVVFGDAELRSEVAPDAQAAPLPTCSATANVRVNVRTGPGAGYAVADTLRIGDPVTVNARNTTYDDWVRIDYAKGGSGWAHSGLFTLDCALDTLTAVNEQDPRRYTAPMQAFYLSAGIGEPQCAEAPYDGLLVQAPQDAIVHFMINGIEVTLGSTAFFLMADAETVVASALQGTVAITSAGETQVAEAGNYIAAVPGRPPTIPQQCDPKFLDALPVRLLPILVELPWDGASEMMMDMDMDSAEGDSMMEESGEMMEDDSSTTSEAAPEVISLVVPGSSALFDSGVSVHAGQTFTITASGAVNPCAGGGEDGAYCIFYGPDGGVAPGVASNEFGVFPAPDLSFMALLARIGEGGAWFQVGAGGAFTADRDGVLQFLVNDNLRSDNRGAFTVEIVPGRG